MIRNTCVAMLGLSSLLAAAEPAVDYQRDIKPLLRERCYSCHGGLKQESGLRVDTAAALLKGGDSGAVVAPGDPAASQIIARITDPDPATRMPPEGMPLTAEQIEHIRAWIQEGSRSPADEVPEASADEHWAFRKPVRPALPELRHLTAATSIDTFVAAKLEEHGLNPRPRASRETLLRRVTLDLTGLPPTPEELHRFLEDESSSAWESVVDRLLRDPHYGERWGRHWMDIWRYSDWYGRREIKDVRNSASQIWRWRDWIVRSLNEDRGYDDMVRQMLAADELAPADYDNAVATGFLIRNYYSLNLNDWMRNTVEHTGKAFLGLTFNCAHCHDHKYDPIAHEDYFRLRAFFEPLYIRQDRLPGEADPGPFVEYVYGASGPVQRLGMVRAFDRNADAVTWFYTGGDERNRVKERGSIPPGVPAFLAGVPLKIEPVSLPVEVWYPGIRPQIQETMLSDARMALTRATADLAAARESEAPPTESQQKQLADAEAAYAEASQQSVAAGIPGAISGGQSLLLNAASGRRILTNTLPQLKVLPERFTLQFELRIVADAHFNFQLIRDSTQGLTAGYVAFHNGRIVAYRPASFEEFDVGAYQFGAGQNRFAVTLEIQPTADQCRLTVRSVSDDVVLVSEVPVALNGWNPVGVATRPIAFDARTGSVAIIDNVCLKSFDATRDAAAGPPAAADALILLDFEAPVYADGQDVAGIEGWSVSGSSTAPATSMVSSTAANPALQGPWLALEAARQAPRRAQRKLAAAEAGVSAAEAALAALEVRLEAERAQHGGGDASQHSDLVRRASRLVREADLKKARADVLAGESRLADAEALAADDTTRPKQVSDANTAIAAAKTAVEKAEMALNDSALDAACPPLSPRFPTSSTGRRRALAEWMTHRDHPLTARVAVNHIWSRHFHAALVPTVSDFGRNGARPTHPELLDWLATEFMDSGWSMKHLHRLIVTSEAYQRLSSVGTATREAAADPENQWLWRRNAGRMEAEVVRDSVLFAAGRLDPQMGGQETENTESLTTFRRSLYYAVHAEGGGASKFGELFDAPDPLDCYRRTRSIIPQQALALTNSEFVHENAAQIAREEHEKASGDPLLQEPFVVAVFERILSRRPTAEELQVCSNAVVELKSHFSDASEDDRTRKAREGLVRALFNHNDFVTIR